MEGWEITKTWSEYLRILRFGRNAAKAYGRTEDKPSWWPKKPKWINFRCPSKSSKEECTKLIRRLLQGHSIDPETYYVDYPNEEDESSDSSSSEESVDQNNGKIDYEDDDEDNVLEDCQGEDEERDFVDDEERDVDVRGARVAALIDEYSEHIDGTQKMKEKNRQKERKLKTGHAIAFGPVF